MVKFRTKLRLLKKRHHLEINDEEARIAPHLKAIEHQYNNEIVDLARSIEDKQVPLHSEIIRLKKSSAEADRRIAKYGENEKSAAKSDKTGKDALETQNQECKRRAFSHRKTNQNKRKSH